MFSTNGTVSSFDRVRVLRNLITIRSEWEDAANGIPLNNIQGSVGLLLADVTCALGLTPEEQMEVLGNSVELQ